MARAKRKAAPGRRIIDGVAMRAVLKSYQDGVIDQRRARDLLLKLGVAGAAADAMVHAFKPRVTEAAP